MVMFRNLVILSLYFHLVHSGEHLDGEMSFSLDNHAELDIIHFEDEQSFIQRFINDPEISKTALFNNITKSAADNSIPGDLGLPVILQDVTKDIQEYIDGGYEIFGYNKYVSDLIPVERRLPDKRNDWCFTPNRISSTILPTSVVICFYNEAVSVLLRTIYSIINRSPPHLLAEIILLDDFSDIGNTNTEDKILISKFDPFYGVKDDTNFKLKEALDNIPKVKFIRMPRREGLIRCRILGALIAHAPILTFLDSHVEVGPGWLEPLLDRGKMGQEEMHRYASYAESFFIPVTKSWTTIAIPMFNTIDPNTFAISFSSTLTSIGGFKWNLMFTFREMSGRNPQNTPADPVPTPTMPGGFFSIHRDFFNHLGKYDDKFEIWGGENIELSFKAWMCGGKLEILPCSNVAHLERTKTVYSRDLAKKNNARLAAVWLDEYAGFYFNVIASKQGDTESYDAKTYGDISSRLELKQNLNCSTFDWYLHNVAPEMFNPKYAIAFGEVRNLQQVDEKLFCLDSIVSSFENINTEQLPSLLWECHGGSGNQLWYYTEMGEIRTEEKCLDYFGKEIVLYNCHGQKGNQEWEYHADTGVIVHPKTQLCLTLEMNEIQLKMEPCQGEIKQRWKFEIHKLHDIYGVAKFDR